MTYLPSSPIAITGMGLLTGLGRGLEANWNALLAGKDARRPVSLFNVAECRCKDAVEIDLDTSGKLSRASRLAIPAALDALTQAGLLDEHGSCKVENLPLSLSTTAGGMEYGQNFLRDLLDKRRPTAQIARYQPQQQALDLQYALRIDGPLTIIANACASGANAIGHAMDLIRSGQHTAVLAGGFEALCELVFCGFDCLQALSPDLCRPFDQNRNGLMLGEGAAFLVLEEVDSALARGADILCTVSGYGHSTDLHHLTQPQPDGKALVASMKRALAQAALHPGDIGYINAHGTATPMNDGAEAQAYLDIFADRLPPVRSTKAAIGHTLGAAGAVEAVISILSLLSKKVPPQIHTREPLPELETALSKGAHFSSSHVMSVNLGFGGSNAALIFSKPARIAPAPSRGDQKVLRAAICGQGAVSPKGCGISALFDPSEVEESGMALISHPQIACPVFQVPASAAELTRWRSHPRLRRASPLTLYLAAAAEEALTNLSEQQRDRTGIVAALGSGANIYSRKFYADIVLKGRRFASPLLFPETVFNSPISHIAAAFGISGPCYTIVGDETAWPEALKIAAIWLNNRDVDHVLVLGGEELDASAMEVYRTFGWIRPGKAFRPSEGAAALLLARPEDPTGTEIVISSPSFSYRNRKQAEQALGKAASVLDPGLPVFETLSHSWLAPLERAAVRAFKKVSNPYPYLGDAFTASAAWNSLRCIRQSIPSASQIIAGSNAAVTSVTFNQH